MHLKLSPVDIQIYIRECLINIIPVANTQSNKLCRIRYSIIFCVVLVFSINAIAIMMK